jgi:mono/diheme cytochrome c family protein
VQEGKMKRAARRLTTVTAVAALTAGLSGCGLTDYDEDLVNGKQLFVERCGSCHVLDRAGTTGVAGPDLDAAFDNARAVGFGESTFKGVVHRQIQQPNPDTQTDPKTGEEMGLMPADLVTGDDARDVAAYVAMAAASGEEDTGQLADVGATEAEGTAEAENGELEIPAEPSGSLAYVFASARAPAGPLSIVSPNESSVPHNIALEGNGVDEVGPVVQDGGVSEIDVDLDPGTYVFYCSVPGHREGGMEGELTVE